MANYAVVRTDNMFGTDNREGLVSIEYIVTSGSPSVDTPTAIENGNVLKVDSLMNGEREIYKGVAPAANDDINDIVLVASPEIMYDEHKHNLSDFINPAGKAARGYWLHPHSVFSVTKEALAFATDEATDGKVGSIVELKAGTKLNVVAAATGATSGSTVVGEIIAIDNVGRYKFYAIRVC